MPTRWHNDSELLEIQLKLGVSFTDSRLLLKALTHESFMNELCGAELDGFDADSNERLEFLGDAVINFKIAEKLYRRLPSIDEGELSLARSYVVRKETLADAARRIGLGEHIVLSRGEARSGLAFRESVLEDAYEALVGALYLDGGMVAAESFVDVTLGEVIEKVISEGVEKDAKSALQELVQAQGFRSPKYATERERRVGVSEPRYISRVRVADSTAGEGRGTSKSKAEQDAARSALESFADGVPNTFSLAPALDASSPHISKSSRRLIKRSVGKPPVTIGHRKSGGLLSNFAERLLNVSVLGFSFVKTPSGNRPD